MWFEITLSRQMSLNDTMNHYRFEDIKIGLREEFDVTVTSEMMEIFLKVSGDNNPLHTDTRYAANKGFKDLVVYGMLTASFYSTLVGVYLPGEFCLLQGINISFHKPVFVGEKLTISGEVSSIHEAFRQAEIKAYIVNQDGKKISKALIKVGLNG